MITSVTKQLSNKDFSSVWRLVLLYLVVRFQGYTTRKNGDFYASYTEIKILEIFLIFFEKTLDILRLSRYNVFT